ncbi:MAG: glutaredoxin family protein [Betaproteobacteria bacterium]|nr:glutaredoxin family protein [Betaproteobacteria bacterium]
MRHLLMLCLLLAGSMAMAETYKWTEGGKTVISDSPPPGTAKLVAKTGSSAEPSDNLSFAVKKAMEAFPVTLYTAPECTNDCKQARDLLNTRGVPFTEKVIQKPEEAEELKQLVGDLYVPTIKVGNQKFRGIEPGAYNNLLDLAGYPKAAPYGSKTAGGQSK